jgi:hypothetical protein
MLAWAVVLFLITRVAAPRAAWTGLVAVTLQLTLVQEVTDGWLLLAIESVGFVAFAVALWQLDWVPRIVPALLVAFPVVDTLTPRHANVAELAAFTMFVAAGLVLSRALSATQARATRPDVTVEWPQACSPLRACAPGRTCCTWRDPRERMDHLRFARPVG